MSETRYVMIENTQTKIDISLYPAERWVLELCEGKVFESLSQFQNLCMVVNVSQEAYEKGLGCPRDAKLAINTIKNLKTF